MPSKPPTPVCKAFLLCHQIAEDPQSKLWSLVNLVDKFSFQYYPNASPLSIFARCTSGHGKYQMGLQLENSDGEAVWREGPPGPWEMADPLRLVDLRFNVCLVFPKPGKYNLLLLANEEEVARHPVEAFLKQPPS